MNVVYVLSMFPYLTTTFVDREILEMIRSGTDLTLVSLHKPEPFETTPEIGKLAQTTWYLLPISWPKLVAAHLWFALRKPRSYLGTLTYLLTRPHRTIGAWMRTLYYWIVGVRAAHMLTDRARRATHDPDGADRPAQNRVDHVHAHFADRATVIAMVISRLLDVPYSVFAHAYDIYVSPVMLPEKMDGAKFVATCTAYNKSYLERLDGGRFVAKVHLVYHGLDLTQFQLTRRDGAQRHMTDSQRPLVLSVGQLKEKKGFPYLIRACRLLKDRGYDFACEIVGEGPEREQLEALIQALHLDDTIVLHGALPHPEVIQKYAQATLFALACVPAEDGDRDGLPNVLLEAMAMQVPVVSTRFSGIPEAVQDGHTGLLVPPRDSEALAEALARFLDDQPLRDRLGQAGRKLVENLYDIHKNTAQLVELFRS